MSLLLRSLQDLFFPRLCAGCGQHLALGEKLVCVHCQMCLPLETNHDWTGNWRVNQWATHEHLERIGALTRYCRRNAAANIVHALKYQRIHALGSWMGQVAVHLLSDTGLFDGVDALVPLPITPARRHYRGFNQSELIAQGMSEALGLPVLPEALRRTIDRESQTHFTTQQRRQNAVNVFQLGITDGLDAKHLMLVDDVMTTGTTMLSALTTLEQLPDIRISCFAWAWVPRSRALMKATNTYIQT